MTNLFEEKLKTLYESSEEKYKLKDGLVIKDEPAHTREVAHLRGCGSGRESAEYYAAGMALGQLNAAKGLLILQALKKLQISDREDRHYGGFRWYKEEIKINDSNAAFFILMPLTVLRLKRPERLPVEHVAILDEMMEKGVEWFAGECHNPILYYSNKILSDGALLLAISSVMKHDEYAAKARHFFSSWEDYTERRGWGWGENCSITYLRVILEALHTACIVLEKDPEGVELCSKLRNRTKQIKDVVRFHGGYEFVPAIRSYNFSGKPTIDNMIWELSGVGSIAESRPVPLGAMRKINTHILFEETMKLNLSTKVHSTDLPHQIENSRTRSERIFDNSYAYTWIGKHGRMGSINRFPVLAGCYHHESWGLGWQSFPIGFCVNSEQVSYLRLMVKEQDQIRTHPAESKLGYLNPGLFAGSCLPDVETRSSQNENTLIAVRSISRLHHTAREIADEWCIQRFRGEIKKFTIPTPAGNRDWIVLEYEEVSIAITALNGITEQDWSRKEIPISVIEINDSVYIRQILYNGEEKIVCHPRLEASWGVIFIDEQMEQAQLNSFLTQIKILDEPVPDSEVPRLEYNQKRNIAINVENREIVSLTIDPYNFE